MTHKIGKLKTERTILINDGEIVDSPIISVNGSLDLTKYDDITSMVSWDEYSDNLCTDRLQTRDRIKEILNSQGWSGSTDNDKEIVIKYYLKETNKEDSVSNTEKVMFLMGKGYTLEQAQGRLIQAYSTFHIIEINACHSRANSAKLFEVIAKYLDLSDASDLIKITHKLFDLYKTQAIRGVNDGNAGEGLFDFLESTIGTSYETTGLTQQGYTLNTGDNTTFINELMDVLRKGNY